MTKVFYLFFFFIVHFFYSQKKELERINDLLDQSKGHILKDNIKSLHYAKQASAIAEKTNDSRIISESYLQLSSCLEQLNFHEESLFYIEKGLKEIATKKDSRLLVLFKEMKAANYLALRLYDQELQEYFEIINLISENKEEDFKQIYSRINARLASYYLGKKEYKYAERCINLSIDIWEQYDRKKDWAELSDIYLIKGYIYLENNKQDSSVFFFNKSYQLLKQSNKSKFQPLTAFGEYFFKQKQYQRALNAYTLAQIDLGVYNIADIYSSRDINKRISEVYYKIGNYENHKRYFQKYILENQKIQQSDEKNIQAAVNSILKEKNQKMEEDQAYIFSVILYVVAISIIIILFIFFRYRRVKNLNHVQLIEKDNQLKVNHIYTHQLEQKLQITLEEVLLEAENSSLFFEKFQILFPNFISKLLQTNQNLTSSELLLLAYIYLNFNSKEIAEYTFRSYRTIQTRKYNLRKKLGIRSHNDFYTELRNIC